MAEFHEIYQNTDFSTKMTKNNVFLNALYFFTLLDSCAVSGICLLFLTAAQAICVTLFGPGKFYNHILDMCNIQNKYGKFFSNYVLKYFMIACWSFFTPVLCIGVMLYCLIKYKFQTEEDGFNTFGNVLEVMFILSSIICPLVGLIIYYFFGGKELNDPINIQHEVHKRKQYQAARKEVED